MESRAVTVSLRRQLESLFLRGRGLCSGIVTRIRRGFPKFLALNPLFCLAIAAVLGVVLADSDSGHRWVWTTFALISGVFILWRPRVWMLMVTTALVFAHVHQDCLLESRDHPVRSLLRRSDKVTVAVRGRFIRAPMVEDNKPGWRVAVFEVDEIDLPTRQKTVAGRTRIRVWMEGHRFVPVSGRYELRGHLRLISRGWNPGLFDLEATALRQGVVAELSMTDVRLLQQDRFGFWLPMLEMAERSRAWIAGQLAQGIQDDVQASTLVTTMALGTAQSGNAELEEPFRNSGTIHIFAVSGLHVGLLAVILWQLLKITGLGRERAIWVLLPVIVSYAFVTGWVPSAARAAIMSCVLMIAPLINRQSRLLNNLGLAALLLLGSDTLQLYQPGFQLSFAVLAAIAMLARPLAQPFERFTGLDPFLPPVLASFKDRCWRDFRQYLLASLSTSTAAWLGSLPFLMMHFHTCTPVSIAANMVLVPLSFVSLFTITLTLVAAVGHLHGLVVVLNNANWFFSKLMIFSASAFSAIPGGHFTLHPGQLRQQPPATLSVMSMPPGEGANLLSSGGQHWMLDCGGRAHLRRNVESFLRSENISQIDGIIASHADAGHIGGAPSLLGDGRKVPILAGMHEPWKWDARSTAMWQLWKGHQEQFQRVQAGDRRRIGNVEVHVLFPSPSDLHDKADDRCLVARFDVGDMRVLWCSDAGFLAEKALLQRYSAAELRSQVLVRNQHGTDWSNLPEFLMAVQPAVLISSNAPAFADERLPDHVRRDCDRLGIRLLDLNVTGMVRLVMEEQQIQLSTWLTGENIRLLPEAAGLDRPRLPGAALGTASQAE